MGLIRTRAEDWRLAAEVVESDKVRWAVGSFKSYKSADSDFIFPILFQEELDLIIGRLTRILRACLALNYIISNMEISEGSVHPQGKGKLHFSQ